MTEKSAQNFKNLENKNRKHFSSFYRAFIEANKTIFRSWEPDFKGSKLISDYKKLAQTFN